MIMTLNDLKTGMIVTTRNGNSYIVMRDFLGDISVLAGISDNKTISRQWINMIWYEQDLTCTDISRLDIISVYSSDPCDIDIKKGLIWERKEYKEVTMQEIEEKFGCKVKIVGNEEKNNDGWIPCSEKLPEDGDCRFYMCTV